MLIKVSYPHKISSIYQFQKRGRNIYQIIDFLENKLKLKKVKLIKGKKDLLLLRDIINLHNTDGVIKKKIKEKIKEAGNGEIPYSSNLPNIKLAKLGTRYILFDGHHSMLAYMFLGKKLLNQIPHLIVCNIRYKDVLVFFGGHANKIKGNWENYALNWQASRIKQLCQKKQKNMGELFDTLYPTL